MYSKACFRDARVSFARRVYVAAVDAYARLPSLILLPLAVKPLNTGRGTSPPPPRRRRRRRFAGRRGGAPSVAAAAAVLPTDRSARIFRSRRKGYGVIRRHIAPL
jgi:hypothetical protein